MASYLIDMPCNVDRNLKLSQVVDRIYLEANSTEKAARKFFYRQKLFFLKGSLMLKVWDAMDHRATMDIDLLGRTSNQIENLYRIISEIAAISCEDDAIMFDTQKLILRTTQTTGDYNGISASFSVKLFTTKMPLLIEIGFNDLIIPEPQKIQYPTLLGMSELNLFGYTPETVIAEKLESIVKLALVNTRLKDFYDLWTILGTHEIKSDKLKKAVIEVFENRKTPFKRPIAFTSAFYNAKETQKRWDHFLFSIGKETILFENVILDLARRLDPLF